MTESTNDQITARIDRLEVDLSDTRKRLAGTQAALMIIAGHCAGDGTGSALLSSKLEAFQKEHEDGFPAEYFEAFNNVRGQLASQH